MAQAAALRDGPGARLVQRRSPGVGGDVVTSSLDGALALCLCGDGRNTSDVLKDDGWREIINGAATAHPLPAPTLRAFLKAGRLFSELSGLMPPEAATALAELPMGAVGTVAHLGTAVVVTGEEIEPIAAELEQFGEVRRF
jgi:pantoate kinase